MANKLASSVTKIVEILSPLDPEDRVRVVNASLTLFGEGPTSKTLPGQMQGVSTPSGEGNVDQLGISNQASAWLNRNGISKEDLEAWYDFKQGAVTLLALPRNASTHSQQAINTYLLFGFAAFLASGDTSFSDGDARERCQHFGCYDSTNHSKIYRAFGNKITGSKSAGWKLTVPGLNAAGALLKGSNPA